MKNQHNTQSNIQQDQFWKIHEKFLKDNLITESPHKNTFNLSNLCANDLPQAFRIFQQVELDAITKLYAHIPMITHLYESICECIDSGNKIVLIGCGSSGRLAALLKILWNIYNHTDIQKAKLVVNISAGGDISLIQAVEQFEDQEISGIEQLIHHGFNYNDLLIGLSAGGESPFILSALTHAAAHSKHKPWLITNNPIKNLVARNKNHPSTTTDINTLELVVGEMALAGSTRLQATTAMQLVLGIGLLNCSANYTKINIKDAIHEVYELITMIPLISLDPITQYEAQLFKHGKHILYQTNNSLLALILFSDIAERAPTFNINATDHFSVVINMHGNYQNTTNSNNYNKNNTNNDYALNNIIHGIVPQAFAVTINPQHNTHVANWQFHANHENKLVISLDNYSAIVPTSTNHFYNTFIYKICLNAHSTLMFGRMGYFEGNLMLSVKPSNFKLIDRIIRYSQFILLHKFNKQITYKEIADIVFDEIKHLQPDQSIVQKVVNRF